MLLDAYYSIVINEVKGVDHVIMFTNAVGQETVWNTERRSGVSFGKIVGELLASNQANSFWRKALIVENEEKPSVLFLIGFHFFFLIFFIPLFLMCSPS